MAGGPLSGAPSRGRRSYRPVSEINITPMVDVMLVLLIIFMVTAPLLTSVVPVQLPQAQGTAVNDHLEPITIAIDAQSRVYVEDEEVPIDQLIAHLQQLTAAKPERTIAVRADKTISYGQVMSTMSMIAASGFTKISLITEGSSVDRLKAAVKGKN